MAARKFYGDTRDEFGALAGKGRGAVYAWEKGITPIPLDVRELANARYGLAIEEMGPMPNVDTHTTGKNDPAAELALWVLKNVPESEENRVARNLAFATLEKRITQKL